MKANDPTLLAQIMKVLSQGAKGKSKRPQFMTSYQILHRLPVATKSALIGQYGDPGANAGKHYTAASHIDRALRNLRGRIQVEYLDAKGISFGGGGTRAGYPVCGLYRLDPYP